MTSSLRGCVVEAVSPRRQPLPVGQTAHRCVFPGSDSRIEKQEYALTDLPAAGSSLMTCSGQHSLFVVVFLFAFDSASLPVHFPSGFALEAGDPASPD